MLIPYDLHAGVLVYVLIPLHKILVKITKNPLGVLLVIILGISRVALSLVYPGVPSCGRIYSSITSLRFSRSMVTERSLSESRTAEVTSPDPSIRTFIDSLAPWTLTVIGRALSPVT